MRLITFGSTILLCGVLAAAEKKPGPVKGGNDVVDIVASVFADKPSVIELLGRDPGFDLVIVKVQVTPKADEKVQIWRDDFTLLLSRDGQKSQPLEPGQIAGRGGMVLSPEGGPASKGFGRNGGGVGLGGVRIGSSGASTGGEKPTAAVKTGSDEPDNPLLQVLKEKIFPETDSNDPSSGLLYFIFDGKPPKVKDLTLIYKFRGGKVILDFKP